jgi:hypothetical protein
MCVRAICQVEESDCSGSDEEGGKEQEEVVTLADAHKLGVRSIVKLNEGAVYC